MDANDVRPNMRVVYTNPYDKFGLTHRDLGRQFTVTSRQWNESGQQWLFDLTDAWDDGRFNVPADRFEPVPAEESEVTGNAGNDVLDQVHEKSDELERLLSEKLGYAKVTSYVDGVTKIETSWKGLVLLYSLVAEAGQDVPA